MMKNGLIYEIAKPFVCAAYYTNAVEGFKYLFGLFGKSPTQVKQLKGIAIDVFVILKWILVIILWLCRIESPIIIGLAIYLIWTNLFTYFYHHVWEIKGKMNQHRKRRRFINLILAILFSNIAFGYIYDLGFSSHFYVAEGFKGELSFLLYSCYTSVIGDYQFINPIDNVGSIITSIQIAVTFFFATIILSNSIPD
jgi:hypothetical protein